MLFHDTKEDILKNFSNQTLTFLKISSFMTHRRKTLGEHIKAKFILFIIFLEGGV